ncbi:MAG TPA: hypothetical protein PKE26_07775 [Kiritimatiellia bacterium]|nr:hypothetical protein [Kiritimatiellia bacterium]HMO98990.1 hypothetical protein [Kiritimatiellia bacterium]HMP95877.1 hypothetical protein [Kiritimatiellia bacterium]
MQPSDLKAAALELITERGGTGRLPVTGCSMEPMFREGDVLDVLWGGQRIGWGDVVVFSRTGSLIAHRVIGRAVRQGVPSVLEKGDHAPGASWIPESAVLGVVIRVGRKGAVVDLQTKSARRAGRLLAFQSRLAWHIVRICPGRPPAWMRRLSGWLRERLRERADGKPEASS